MGAVKNKHQNIILSHKVPVVNLRFGRIYEVICWNAVLKALRNVTHVPQAWHDDVIKWKHFPRYLPFVRAIHRSPVNSPHKGQWRALMFLWSAPWINGWENNRESHDLRRHRAHYDVIVMGSPDFAISPHEFSWVRKSADIDVAVAKLFLTESRTTNLACCFLSRKWDTTKTQLRGSPSKHPWGLTHLPCTKWPPFRRRYFQMHYCEWKVLYSD